MDEFLDSSSDSDNVKGVLLGRTFCLASLIKSEQGDLAQHVKIMKELFKILKTKEYLTQLTVELLIELITNPKFRSEELFKTQLEDGLISLGPKVCTCPDLALFLFTARRENILDEKRFKVIWGA